MENKDGADILVYVVLLVNIRVCTHNTYNT